MTGYCRTWDKLHSLGCRTGIASGLLRPLEEPELSGLGYFADMVGYTLTFCYAETRC